MNAFLEILRTPLVDRLGWSLIHVTWQGFAVAIVLLIAFQIIRSARVRYLCAGLALAVLPVCFVMTFVVSSSDRDDLVRGIDADAEISNSLIGSEDNVAPHSSNFPVSPGSVAKVSVAEASVAEANAARAVGAYDGQTDSSVNQPLGGSHDLNVITAGAQPDREIDAPKLGDAESSVEVTAVAKSTIGERIEATLPWLVVAWLVGMLVLAVWNFGGWLSLRRLTRSGVSSIPDWVHQSAERLRGQLGIRCPITLLESSRVTVPAVLGVFKPVVLIPACVITGLKPDELEAVLAHELAHIRRHDYAWNLAQTVVETVLFFHPVVWWISERIREERENCCDDLAIECTSDRLRYAQSLTRLEELRHDGLAGRSPALVMSASGGKLLSRICRVLGVQRPKPKRNRLATVGITGLSGALAIVLAAAMVLLGWASSTPDVSANVAPAATARKQSTGRVKKKASAKKKQKRNSTGKEPIQTELDGLLVFHDVPIHAFGEGAMVPLGQGHHRFDNVPDFLKGRRYTRRGGYQGILKFKVQQSQRVYFAVYAADWGGGGDTRGTWLSEVTSRDDLEKAGWKEAAQLEGKLVTGNPDVDNATPSTAWVVFGRDCKTGESFAIRTHKYQAPILFSDKETAAQRAPLRAKGQTPKLLKRNAIDLGRQHVQLQTYPADQLKPGLFAIELFPIRESPGGMKAVYGLRKNGRIRDGYWELVGRFPGEYSGAYEYKVDRFERVGRKVTAIVKMIAKKSVKQASAEKMSVYVQAALPALPAGDYIAELKLHDVAGDYKYRESRSTTITCPLSVPQGDAFAVELSRLANYAIQARSSSWDLANNWNRAVNPEGLPFDGTKLYPAGTKLSAILKLTGQDAAVANFTSNPKEFAKEVGRLVESKKTWALCALLDHAQIEVRHLAARGLAKLGDPNSAGAVMVAAGRIPMFEGFRLLMRNGRGTNFEEGDWISTKKSHEVEVALREALEKIVGVSLQKTDKGVGGTGNGELRVGPFGYESSIQFELVADWLRKVYLPAPTTVESAVKPQVEIQRIQEAIAAARKSGNAALVKQYEAKLAELNMDSEPIGIPQVERVESQIDYVRRQIPALLKEAAGLRKIGRLDDAKEHEQKAEYRRRQLRDLLQKEQEAEGDRTNADPLLRQLETDFQSLLQVDRNRTQLMEAARLLAQTNDNSHWTNYSKATAILRKIRSKAAVPLLLKYMVVHMERSSCHVMIPAYAETLSIITGKDIPSPYQSGPGGPMQVRSAVQKLVNDWWEKERDKPASEFAATTTGQHRVALNKLLDRERRANEYYDRGSERQQRETAYSLYHVMFYNVMNRNRSGSDADWSAEELHPAMTNLLLEAAGYSIKPLGDVNAIGRVPLETVAMLASLRRNGHAEQLKEVAFDFRQDSAVRLVCALALYRAREQLEIDVFLKVLASEKRLERRLIAILALGFAGDADVVVPALLKQLDDRDIEIATAAACALQGFRPPQAVPRLAKLVNEMDGGQASIMLFKTIGEYETVEAQRILCDYLKEAIQGGRKRESLTRALSALEQSSGQRWTEAGAHSEAYYVAKARLAIDWWNKQQAAAAKEIEMAQIALENAKARVASAEAVLRLRKTESDRLQQLAKQGVIDPKEAVDGLKKLSEAERELVSNHDKLERAMERLQALEAAR